MKMIAYTIYYLTLTALIGVILLLILSSLPNTPGNVRFLVVQSGSMEPALMTGSVVVVRPESRYQAGDIITFTTSSDRPPTTHRVVDVLNENGRTRFVTKGDANTEQDTSRVDERQVIGSVHLHIPYLGYVINFAKTPMGVVLLIVIPAVVVVLDEVRKIAREIRRIRLSTNK